MAKRLRSGYTTGACAAAAAKAAAEVLRDRTEVKSVELTFPGGSHHSFLVHDCRVLKRAGWASTIKDAGDDPDVTNGAEICALVRPLAEKEAHDNGLFYENLMLAGGEGVGRVTKPGLAVNVGEPAINPVPRKMIAEAVRSIFPTGRYLVEISITNGELLAEKTLNKRLGILGGLSVLGTTGIVRPVSADAWKATIEASLDVALEAGLEEVVLSTGRTSEKGVQSELNLAEESYAMMGDYLEFSLQQAGERGFSRICLAGMWAKITKAALRVPQTHVRHGALEMEDAARLLGKLGAEGELLVRISGSNTAREMYEHLFAAGKNDVIRAVCQLAKEYAQEISGKEVRVFLVNAKAEVVERV